MKVTKRPVDRTAGKARASAGERYVLEDQIGYLLRQVSQRHAVIFAELIGEDITPTPVSYTHLTLPTILRV